MSRRKRSITSAIKIEIILEPQLERKNTVIYSTARTQRKATSSWADPEGETGRPDHLKNHNNLMFLSNTGPDPLKIHKATKPAFNVGQSSGRQKLAGWPMMVHLK